MSHSPAEPRRADPSAAELRRVAISAAHEAGDPLKTAFRSQMDIQLKTSAHDLVTVWDRRTEETLVSLLSDAVPDSRFLGEEGGTRGSGRIEWIIDPIDGTSNFAHGFAMFSISIAAVIDDVVLAGVVYDPINELTFSADDDAAYLADRDGTERVLTPASREGVPEENLSLLTNFPGAWAVETHGDEALRAFAGLVTTYATVRRIVSGALELCHLAAGWSDAALNCRTSPWDIAAAQLVLRRAGGRFLPYGTRGERTWSGEQTPDLHLTSGYLGLAPGASAPTAEDVVRRFTRAQ
ncbi:inositol monophosphatase family protein [Nesterenkonia flava]|uniref:inositol-phosphate phosphatase n=1 Tax=Nesterenkonia flava TaxID=469799 RepID=A0ABU1FVQ4_9MICC|nr:inositol monophosphatase family protein [Nesterenkonia flava]MDR5712752.1 inositol monophosphatase family protein [Nesterenkonia flava]